MAVLEVFIRSCLSARVNSIVADKSTEAWPVGACASVTLRFLVPAAAAANIGAALNLCLDADGAPFSPSGDGC